MRGTTEYWSTDRDASTVVDQWREMLSATHLPWSVAVPRPRTAGFEATIRRWWIDDLALVDCTCDPCSGTRTKRDIAGTDGEFVVVLINRGGRETVAQSGAEAGLQPGDAVVWDSSATARFAVEEPLTKRSLLIPRSALDEIVGRAQVTGGVMLDGSRPATRLLTSYLDTLSAALPELDQAAVSAARNATLELFIGALRTAGDTPESTVTQPALRAAMDRYIERHLADQLSPGRLARAHGVSLRTVNRIFTASGQTVGEVVRVRRLARAREELAGTDRPVASIAHRYGFSDASHLSRLFKAHYGATPREYRTAARADGAHVQVRGAEVQGPGAGRRETGVTATQG
ncbi:helix-turn-helix domain-containing protein [Pseudonocardia endophytica]|uniref:AraC-like DNA-binding protein n=1 Tax=Pseudonocardia endophytica TaxID=401976 RepID=A0A4V2PHS4_PSEEN|nr:helix-turn-helix domain-containing protein [Pseudonocardia endophytica]TCK21906.1 AraC-like DNA-binding protein [Pseudonocardia endophytica]